MSEQRIRVVVCGAAGRMGREVVRAVAEAADTELVAAVDRQEIGQDAGALAGIGPLGVAITSDLEAALADGKAEVLVDFTVPGEAQKNIPCAIAHGVSPVIGTTGFRKEELTGYDEALRAQKMGGLLAPNFAIGAVLMMKFAAQAARYMPDVEIIELHHDRKLDSPSGTALLTAQLIGQARHESRVAPADLPEGLIEKAPGARGARNDATGDVPIHSVRLPGFVAHQEVIFGGPGQVLTLRHDSLDRRSFMPGVLLAIRRVGTLNGLVIGLEHLL